MPSAPRDSPRTLRRRNRSASTSRSSTWYTPMPRARAAALSRASGRCLRPVRGFTPSQSRSTLMSLRTRGPVMEKASATSSGVAPCGRVAR